MICRHHWTSFVKKLETANSTSLKERSRAATRHNKGALIIGIGFWGPLYYKYNKYNTEPPKLYWYLLSPLYYSTRIDPL